MKSIYHPGERAVQERAGVANEAERVGRSIRPHIPPTAQTFLLSQPMVVLATADDRGRFWASVLFGQPGFLRAEDERTLRIEARPTSGDPLLENLTEGAQIGVLVIELSSRRRIRLNGRVVSVRDGVSRVSTEQVYSNCPKYIRARSWRPSDKPGEHHGEVIPTRHSSLTERHKAWVVQADTFFIASGHVEGGTDASHRGGTPGFVHVVDDRHLAWGDYPGNNMFQTLGNISVNPFTGLLFIDFERGKTLQLTGSSSIVWDSDRTREFTDAQRVLEFEFEEAIEITHPTRLRWHTRESSVV